MIDTVIFDMDGVLIDSEPIHKSINQRFFEEIGAPVSDKHYHDQFVGLPLEKMLIQLKDEFGLKPAVSELLEKCNRNCYSEFNRAPLKAIDGVEDLIREFRQKGCHLAVGSSSSPDLISLLIRKLGLSSYFEHLVSGYEVEKGKPHPDLFLHIASLFNTQPENCLVIEDSALGLEAAFKAGMKSVAYRNISSGNQNLMRAALVLDSYDPEERTRVLKAFTFR